jgi:MFS transporter, putative metabolite transport protein
MQAPNSEEHRLTPFHTRLAIYSSGGPFLDGYLLSVIGVALVQMTPALHLTTAWQGLIASSTLVGMFFGGVLGGALTDRFGRQLLYRWDLAAILIGSLVQFWVSNGETLFLLRLFIGVAVGADYPIATALSAEFMSVRHRGPVIGWLVSMWFVGAAAAYIVGEALQHLGPDGWRWILASAGLPAAIFMVMRRGTPESPRWLRQKGRNAEARAVIRQVYGEQLPSEYRSPSAGNEIGPAALFTAGYGPRLAFTTLFWTCAIVPLFAVYAFSPTILVALGLTGDLANVGSSVVAALFLLGTSLSIPLINLLGRRRLIVHSFLWSAIALFLLGLFPHGGSGVTFALFAAYAVCIGGTQVMEWVYPNELFPTAVRGTAMGIASSLSRIGAAIGTYLTPIALQKFGIGSTMMWAAGITFVGFLICIGMAPETTGQSLEESAAI